VLVLVRVPGAVVVTAIVVLVRVLMALGRAFLGQVRIHVHIAEDRLQ